MALILNPQTVSVQQQAQVAVPTPINSAPVVSEFLDPTQLVNIERYAAQVAPEISASLNTKFYLDVPSPYVKASSVQNKLLRKSGYFIVLDSGFFVYYKIGDVIPRGEHLFEISGKRPPVLREGLIVISKEVYLITIEDIQRGLIRKSRKLKLRSGSITYDDFLNGSASKVNKPIKQSSESKDAGQKLTLSNLTAVTTKNSVDNREESGSCDDPELAESKAIDMAFKEQVKSLFHPVLEKEGQDWEEWEIET